MNNKCIFCGGELTTGDVDGICITCKIAGIDKLFGFSEKENLFYQGWICPRCGKVHAPWVSCCDCSPPTKTSTSYNTEVDNE